MSEAEKRIEWLRETAKAEEQKRWDLASVLRYDADLLAAQQAVIDRQQFSLRAILHLAQHPAKPANALEGIRSEALDGLGAAASTGKDADE